MRNSQSFRRRGVVEGFFGPVWSMAHRRRLFEFGAARGMNTYLYAPKDDPFHRERWMEPYPEKEWQALLTLFAKHKSATSSLFTAFIPARTFV